MNVSRTLMAALVGLLAQTGAAQAALIDRGGGMIYDTTRNITWLADMNYAKTSGYSSTGSMKWENAKQWASDLVYGGYDDWRLPTINLSDTSCSNHWNPGAGFPVQYSGYNCSGGELSGLFVTDLGNKPGQSVFNQAGDTEVQIANLTLFTNVMPSYYWTSQEHNLPDAMDYFSWTFFPNEARQSYAPRDWNLYAVAVRSGDVVVPSNDVIAAVPEPQTLALTLLALSCSLVVSTRRSR